MHVTHLPSEEVHLKAQGPSRTCNESKQEEEEDLERKVSRPISFGHGIAFCDLRGGICAMVEEFFLNL